MRLSLVIFLVLTLNNIQGQERDIKFSNLVLEDGRTANLFSDFTWEEVLENTGLDVVNISEEQTICKGDTALLTASGGNFSYIWNTGETTASIYVNPQETSIYKVTILDVNGISKTLSTRVNVNLLPDNPISPDVTINKGESTLLGIAYGYEVSWSTGETTDRILVSPNVTTTYQVVNSRNGCSVTKSVTVTVKQPINKSSPTYKPKIERPLLFETPYTIRTPINSEHQDQLIICNELHQINSNPATRKNLVHGSDQLNENAARTWLIYSSKGKKKGERVISGDKIYLSNAEKNQFLAYDSNWGGKITARNVAPNAQEYVIREFNTTGSSPKQYLTNFSNVLLTADVIYTESKIIRNPNPNDDVLYITLENEVLKRLSIVMQNYKQPATMNTGEVGVHEILFTEIPNSIKQDLMSNNLIPIWRFLVSNEFE